MEEYSKKVTIPVGKPTDRTGPWFCVLLVKYLPVSGEATKHTNIVVTHDVTWLTVVENRQLANSYKPTYKGKKRTHIWLATQVMGPFFSYKHAYVCLHMWSHRSRGKIPRMRRGVVIAKRFNLCLKELKVSSPSVVSQYCKLVRKRVVEHAGYHSLQPVRDISSYRMYSLKNYSQAMMKLQKLKRKPITATS